jgi:putative endonuclease
MAQHNEIGKEAEQLAAGYLRKNGFTLLHQNWRYSRYEIDIIAVKNDLLRIIEVKALQTDKYGNPEEAVTKKKFKFLQNAADEFLHLHPQYRNVQFDILSIIMPPGKEATFFLIEDVFL